MPILPATSSCRPGRPGGCGRSAEDEVIDLRHRASFVDRPSRHGAAAALALAGGGTGI